ncbi:MAG: metallophosphoesterase [Anaerolineae bacterium]|nr:metallophosphoesterase [Anaerolineae bacterium]
MTHILTFAHISDTHLHADVNFKGGRDNPLPLVRAQQIIEALHALEAPVSLVLHTGDVGHKIGKPETYSTAQQVLSTVRLPVLSIPGNHDRVTSFQQAILGRSKQEIQPHADQDTEVHGVQFLLLDSHAATDGSAAGWLAPEQLHWLEERATADDPRPLVIALHHHPLPTDATWLDQMMLRNGEDFHAIMRKVGQRLRGVFYGHIHESLVTVRDGIAYYSAPSPWFQTHTWYGQQKPLRLPSQLAAFHLVTLTTDATQVRPIFIQSSHSSRG